MQLKRKFVGDMARMDEDHKKTMQVLTENVTKMTDTFTAGFAMLQQLVINQTSMPMPIHTFYSMSPAATSPSGALVTSSSPVCASSSTKSNNDTNFSAPSSETE